MHISIWQQFSSNHSGSFELIGRFETVEEAQAAADIIWSFLTTVRDWYQENGEDIFDKEDVAPLTPPEKAFVAQHNLSDDWTFSVEWARFMDLEKPLHVYQNLVFLHNPSATWTGSTPFYELLRRLGATVEHHVEGYNDGTEAGVNLSCIAPSEAHARQIADQLRTTIVEGESRRQAIQLPDQKERFQGKVYQEENLLWFIDIPYTSYFSRGNDTLAYEKLPELVSYLEAQGCYDFQFDASSIENAEYPPLEG